MEKVEQDLRERLAKVGRDLFKTGLTYGTAGNISARIPGTNNCLIKPSMFSFDELNPEHFITVDIYTRKVVSGDHKPSIETPFHTTMYKIRADVGGVVHVHPHYATLFAIAEVELVPMGMLVFNTPTLAKGVGIAKYAPPGTEELAQNIAEGMGDKYAVLMPHHGITTIGKTIEEAATIARSVEDLAKLQYEVMQIGKPKPLPEPSLKMIVEMIKKRGAILS